MSASLHKRQNSWEETQEEFERRRKLSNSSQSGWFGTIVGLAMAAAALAILIKM